MSVTKKFAITVLTLGLCASRPALAQERDPHAVQPERPTVATHAGTVAPGWVEIEWGVEWDRYDNGSGGCIVPIFAKIGLSPRLQLNVIQSPVRPPGGDSIHASDLTVGVKWRLADDAPVLGRFAIFPNLKLPTGSAILGSGTDTTDVGLLIISSHDLGRRDGPECFCLAGRRRPGRPRNR